MFFMLLINSPVSWSNPIFLLFKAFVFIRYHGRWIWNMFRKKNGDIHYIYIYTRVYTYKCVNKYIYIYNIYIYIYLYLYLYLYLSTHNISIKFHFFYFPLLISLSQRRPWSSRRPVSAHRGVDMSWRFFGQHLNSLIGWYVVNMGNIWLIYGQYMVHIWLIYGWNMVNIWLMMVNMW